MKNKTKQFTTRFRYTVSNTLRALRARQFIVTFIRRTAKTRQPGSAQNYAAAIMLWRTAKKYHKQNRVQRRAKCILTGRNRGVSGRYNRSRIQLKNLSNAGHLFGARKSSW